MKKVLLGLLGLIMINVALAEGAAPSTSGTLPASVPFAPPGTTITTITTTAAPQAAAAPAAAPAPESYGVATGVAPASAASPATASAAAPTYNGVATGVPPPVAPGPGAVGSPAPLLPPGQTAQGGQATAASPSAHLVDPTLFGTLQDPAFQGMTSKMFPMTAEQIRAFREIYETTKRITAEPTRAPPRPLISTQNVSLSPGTVPPVIRLANGYVSSIVFVDETGAPWPITAYSIGNPHAFNIQWDTESNLMMIQGQGAYATGNMAVSLKKLPTPIMLTIVSEQNVVDYRLDFRVQGRGPNASGSIIGSTLPQNGNNQVLMNLLDGVAPGDARILTVEGGQGQAWVSGSVMYLRTPLTVLSPSWTATMTSPDGTKVYQMTPTPLVLVSDHGRSVPLKVKGL